MIFLFIFISYLYLYIKTGWQMIVHFRLCRLSFFIEASDKQISWEIDTKLFILFFSNLSNIPAKILLQKYIFVKETICVILVIYFRSQFKKNQKKRANFLFFYDLDSLHLITGQVESKDLQRWIINFEINFN